ncbi:hypothetical protein TRICHSKD4_3699 [Roseibium sp. TrichSKD4]|uniref:hypothetical protein n=1 Tax=Roseibium sp. TrichSKD4 TaxID=744980 RepID=UPI0001E56B50|nr:hypothetical protein [Roseibium sp. TrichSKD4]EFO30124.1 hypothetical protein TRICHSKD4_3699 [Roseibium sp. TrichSKD4]
MPKQKHSDDIVFTIYVLWVKGHAEATIAAFLGLTKGQVSGLINRSKYRGRGAWSDRERQRRLDILKSIHRKTDGQLQCGGRLNVFDWKIEPLGAGQGQ